MGTAVPGQETGCVGLCIHTEGSSAQSSCSRAQTFLKEVAGTFSQVLVQELVSATRTDLLKWEEAGARVLVGHSDLALRWSSSPKVPWSVPTLLLSSEMGVL